MGIEIPVLEKKKKGHEIVPYTGGESAQTHRAMVESTATIG